MRKHLIKFILLSLTFIVALYGKKIFMPQGYGYSNYLINTLFNYSWWIVPALVFVVVKYGHKNVFEILGLNKEFLKPLGITLIATLPMLLGYALLGNISQELDYKVLFHKTILAATMEEFLFRGFLFGILFRKLNWGFLPAAILGALIFGLGHVYQGSTIMESSGIFGVTLLGGLLYSWLYVEWNFNLWVPICMHFFMNLAWFVFDISSNALGGIGANAFRFLSVALIIVLTIRFAKKRGFFYISKSNLITKKS